MNHGVPPSHSPSVRDRFRVFAGALACCVFLVLALLDVRADTGYRCDACDRKIESGTVWTLRATNYLCEACHLIPQRCVHCAMPVKIGFATTTDGRHICRRHVPFVVLDEREANNVFRTATDELRRIARGQMELRQGEVPVKLFDTDYWSPKEDDANAGGLHKVGFSRTTWSNGLMNHSVVMLSGQFRETLAAVSAHEYTHLWINENRPTNHVVEPDTIEAICELAAWKLMQGRNEPLEQARIETNGYTKGRIKDLIEVEREIGFMAVLDWVKRGTGAVLSSTGQAPPPVRTGPDPTALAVWRAAVRSPQPPAVEESLHLDGLVEGRNRTVALINGVTVEAGAAADIRLNGALLKVMVETITNRSVVLRTNGHPVPVVLKLDRN
jgi:hypothetical protein